MNETSFNLTVRTRDSVLFTGLVRSITSENQTGAFDILPVHSNFLTILKNNLTLTDTNGNKRQLFVEHGLLRVVENTVTVYLGFKPS